METNLTLNAQITADVGKFITSLDRVNKSVEKAATKMKDVGKKMSTYLTLPLVAAGGVAVANAVKFEKLATSLNVLTGSAEAGAKAFERLKTFSASTPFQLDELVSVNNQLMGFGLTTDKAFESLQMLGDVASVSGADLARVAVAFGQSAAAGRVMTQDLNQFINNGIPIYQLLGDVTGKNVGELRDLASQGKITFDLLEQAFKKGTSEGGKFFGGTEKLSQTLGGRLSTLRDNFNLMMGDIGTLIGDYLSPLIDVVTKLMKGFKDLTPLTKSIIVIIGGITAAIGPLLLGLGAVLTIMPALITAFGSLSVTVNSLIWPITAAVVVIAAFAAIAIDLWNNWDIVTQHLLNAFTYIKNGVITMVQSVVKHLAFLAQGFVNIANLAGFNLTNPLTNLSDKLEGLKGTIIPVTKKWASLGDSMKNAGKAMGLVKGEASGVASGIKKIGDEAKKATAEIEGTTDAMKKLVGTSEGREKGNRSGQQSGSIEDEVVNPEMLGNLDAFNTKLQETQEIAGLVANSVGNAFTTMGYQIVDSFGEATTGAGRFLRGMADTATQLIAMALSQSIGNAIVGATQSGNATGPAAVVATPAFIATAIGGIIGAFAAIPQFATGGIVGGSSFSGDRVMARVNSGEMILNSGQQRNLFSMINGGGNGGSQRLEAVIRGSDILLSNERATKQRTRFRGY